ncbi:MAG: NAD-dependent glyceraldehyde-3-phosphate dehydrogenase, partial [uncultured Solirubrobacteraceae bacterium]
ARQGWHQRLRPHRPQRLPRRAGRGGRHRVGGGQRPHRQRDARAPAQVRLDPGPVPRPGRGDRRRPLRGRQGAEGARGARPRQPAVGRPGRGRRHRVHGLLHQARRRRQAPRRGRQEGRHLRPRQGRGHHGGPRGELRPVRPRPAPRDLQRVVHDELPGAVREGRPRDRGHQARPDDDDPRLHGRPAPARRAAQGPAPRARRRAEPRPDLHGRREGRGPRAARAQRQAPRLRGPRARPDGLHGRPDLRGRPRDVGAGGQRRVPRRGRHARAAGDPEVHRGPHRLLGHRHGPALVHRRRRAHRGPGRHAREGRRLVRQRVGLLQPLRRHRPAGPL